MHAGLASIRHDREAGSSFLVDVIVALCFVLLYKHLPLSVYVMPKTDLSGYRSKHLPRAISLCACEMPKTDLSL